MKNYLLILAGGKGNRLWPISTTKMPKQFVNLYGNEIMINETIRRVENIFDYENIFVIVNEEQRDLAERYIDNKIPRENIITEPQMRNTAMCIFLSSLKIKKMKGDGIVSILSSDHYIEEEEKLQNNILDAIEIAKKDDNLVTIGITPTFPATGFGYIKYEKVEGTDVYYRVSEFKEKPNYEKAVEFVNSGEYVWNSGMYVWNLETILQKFQKHLPDIYKFADTLYNALSTNEEREVIKKVYENVETISIDKGILEKTTSIKMIKSEFKWMDVGSIRSLFEVHKKDKDFNVIIGNSIVNNVSHSNILNKSDELLITIGVEDISIIKNNNVCIVCSNDSIDEIPKIHEDIKKQDEYKRFM